MESSPEVGYLNKREAALYLCVSTRTIEIAMRRGEMVYYRPTRKSLFRREDLDAWVQRRRTGPPQD